MTTNKSHLGRFQYGGHTSAEAERKYKEKAQKQQLSLEEFTESRVLLMREVNNHPKLVATLRNSIDDEWETYVGHIAAFCGVVLDDVYLPEQLDRIYTTLYNRLRAERSPLIMPNRNITPM